MTERRRLGMKQLIKKLTPAPLWIASRESVSRLFLHTIPKSNLPSISPCDISSINLDHILNDGTIIKSWEQDHTNIIELYGNEDKLEGVNPGDRRAIYYLIMAIKPKSVLEIGTHIGASTLHIARALKRLKNGGVVTSVDIVDVNDPTHGPWKKKKLPSSPRDLASQLECLDHIEFLTTSCLSFMEKTDKKFDFIFLDGDHMARAVYKEVGAALSILNDGGIILLHDYYPDAKPLFPDNNIISGPYFALKRIKKENPAIDTLPLGELPWLTKQGSRMTSLALIVKK